MISIASPLKVGFTLGLAECPLFCFDQKSPVSSFGNELMNARCYFGLFWKASAFVSV
jgi:hypothetical protein